MGLQDFLMKHGVGSPGHIAKVMTRQYRLIKESNPGFDEQTVLHYVYANRVAAQSTFGGPEVYQKSRKNPTLMHEAVANNPHLFLLIKHAILIEHPEFQNPFAPSDRFEILDRVIGETIERETRGWGQVPQMPPTISLSIPEVVETNETRPPQPPIRRKSTRPEGGDSVEQALSTFLQACKEPGTLFATDEWVRPRLQSLEALLFDPITSEQAEALCDAIEKRAKLDYVVDWLSSSILPWQMFLERREECERQLKMLDEADRRIKYEQKYWTQQLALRTRAESDWEAQMCDGAGQANHDVSAAVERYGKQAHACPQCGSTELKWFYYTTPLPPFDSKFIHGFAGWKTACERCRVEVDFFSEARVYF